MARNYELATRSSTIDLEKEIRAFAEKTSQSLSMIYRKSHILYMANYEIKKGSTK